MLRRLLLAAGLQRFQVLQEQVADMPLQIASVDDGISAKNDEENQLNLKLQKVGLAHPL